MKSIYSLRKRLMQRVNTPWIRKTFRASRVMFISTGIFSSGYIIGTTAVAKDPEAFQWKMCMETIQSMSKGNHYLALDPSEGNDSIRRHLAGSWSTKKILREMKDSYYSLNSCEKAAAIIKKSKKTDCDEKEIAAMAQAGMRALPVFSRIRQAAIEKVEEDIASVRKNMNEKGITSPALQQLQQRAAELKSKRRLLDRKWQVIVLNNASPNAFVNATIPGKIFLNSGLTEFCETPEEFAMVLGHELSHVLLDHSEQQAYNNLGLSVISLLVISILDPTGIFSLLGEIGIFTMSPLINLGFSRDHETEADELGMELAARACFDPAKLKSTFEKMKAYAAAMSAKGGGSSHELLRSHPIEQHRIDGVVNAQKKLKEIQAQSPACSATAGKYFRSARDLA